MKTEDLHAELTFGDGTLNLSALGDDILVVDAVLLLDQVVTVAVLVSGGGRVALGRELHARNHEPLHEREHDTYHGADRDHDLRRKLREQCHPRRNPSSSSESVHAGKRTVSAPHNQLKDREKRRSRRE